VKIGTAVNAAGGRRCPTQNKLKSHPDRRAGLGRGPALPGPEELDYADARQPVAVVAVAARRREAPLQRQLMQPVRATGRVSIESSSGGRTGSGLAPRAAAPPQRHARGAPRASSPRTPPPARPFPPLYMCQRQAL
jgi:hypothetical protein